MDREERKVLIVVHCFLPESVGGSEFYAYHLAQELRARGYAITLFSALLDTTAKRYKIIRSEFEGINVIKVVNAPIFARSFTDYFIDPTVERLFKGIVAAEKPDLIHFQHTAHLSSRLPEIAFQLGVPSVFTIHDYWFMCYNSHLLRPSEGVCPGPSEGFYCASCSDAFTPNPAAPPRLPILNKMIQLPLIRKLNLKEILPPDIKQKLRLMLYRQPCGPGGHSNPSIMTVLENQHRFHFIRRQFLFPVFVLSPSYHLKRRYENEGYREVLHVPLGFYGNEDLARQPFQGKLKIAYLGNIAPFKGAHIILEELLRVKEKNSVEVHFHGRQIDRPYFSKIKMLCQSFQAGNVTFHGEYRSDRDLKEILSKVHAVVFPSLWEENYPLVVRETLMHGVPVIGSRLGGVPEAIEDGVNGLLFDPYKEGDLAEKINLILEKPGILEKITEGAGNSKIESMDAHIEKIVKLYDDAIPKK